MKNMFVTKNLIAWIISLLTVVSLSSYAQTYNLPTDGGDLVGRVQQHLASTKDTWDNIAKRYDISLHELVEANPMLARHKKLSSGQMIIIPTRYILPPRVYRHGIVINLAELRLYYFPPDQTIVITYPVGLGRSGWRTPLFKSYVVRKKQNPTWYPPQSVREDYYQRSGERLPASVPPGRNNPLGKAALYLKTPSYLIHGNAEPFSIGRFISAGCIRLYNDDIVALYRSVKVGTPVWVINHSMKAGCMKGTCYLEAHKPVKLPSQLPQGRIEPGLQTDAPVAVVRNIKRHVNVNWRKVLDVARQRQGIPRKIGTVIR